MGVYLKKAAGALQQNEKEVRLAHNSTAPFTVGSIVWPSLVISAVF